MAPEVRHPVRVLAHDSVHDTLSRESVDKAHLGWNGVIETTTFVKLCNETCRVSCKYIIRYVESGERVICYHILWSLSSIGQSFIDTTYLSVIESSD